MKTMPGNAEMLMSEMGVQLDELESHLESAEDAAVAQLQLFELAAQQFADYCVYGRCVIPEEFMGRVREIVTESGKPLTLFGSVTEVDNG